MRSRKGFTINCGKNFDERDITCALFGDDYSSFKSLFDEEEVCNNCKFLVFRIFQS